MNLRKQSSNVCFHPTARQLPRFPGKKVSLNKPLEPGGIKPEKKAIPLWE